MGRAYRIPGVLRYSVRRLGERPSSEVSDYLYSWLSEPVQGLTESVQISYGTGARKAMQYSGTNSIFGTFRIVRPEIPGAANMPVAPAKMWNNGGEIRSVPREILWSLYSPGRQCIENTWLLRYITGGAELKYPFFLATVLALGLFLANPARSCNANCHSATCFEVNCQPSKGCTGQYSACTCSGSNIGYTCNTLGPRKCCATTYTEYDDDFSKPCPYGRYLKLKGLGENAQLLSVPTCGGGLALLGADPPSLR